jgi:copper homeostasis protein (lipoprotein)
VKLLPILLSTIAGLAQSPIAAPATFDGVIPCADCPGIRQTLTLRKDGTFVLRRTYFRGDNGTSNGYETGRWSVTGDRLILGAGTEAVQQFRLVKPAGLRMLDRQGNEIEAKLNYDLKQMPVVDPISDTMPTRGMYSAGHFEDCASGRSLPVAEWGDNSRLETGLVSVLGHSVGLAKEELVVDLFQKAEPGASCSGSLEGATWTLTQLNGHPVKATSAQIIFKDKRVSGSSGCNRMTGSYTLEGSKLVLGQMAGTRMACPGDAMELESTFLTALGTVNGFRIAGGTLELLHDGEAVASFSATK